MYNTNMPHKSELPSKAKLIKSTILAAVSAGVLLVTVVMPAEYGIDPTGTGRFLGLKRMGEIKVSLAQEAAAAQAAALASGDQTAALPAGMSVPVVMTEAKPAAAVAKLRTDEMQVTLAPDEGTEIKVELAKGKKVNYSWASDGGRVNFDVHGDSKKMNVDYHGYSKGSEQKSDGVLTAAFDGNHGWFWRNRTSNTLTVTLKVNGEHTGIKHVD
ncbi:MAG: transmembrane anchor protein [Elusimicrobiota bacterium]|nr:transmembrane anchor protein [Elusimicrobiota bacterium]